MKDSRLQIEDWAICAWHNDAAYDVSLIYRQADLQPPLAAGLLILKGTP
ncbi:MAG TPA: hypothetical protein VNN76_10590 [Bacteroidota bacterium]|nr:hypothetical protein [Bacteroidota bacterium]